MTNPVETVGAFYAALGCGDVPAVLDLLHPNVEWTEAEGFPYYSGTWHSPGEVLEKLLIPLSQDWTSFAATADDFIVQGERVVSLGLYTGTNRKTGRTLRAPFAHVWQVRDGKLARFDMFTDTWLVRQAT